MKKNVGGFDRIIRIFLGILITVVGIYKWNSLGIIPIFIGIVLFLTGIIGWCGIYNILGIDTSRKKQK